MAKGDQDDHWAREELRRKAQEAVDRAERERERQRRLIEEEKARQRQYDQRHRKGGK